MYEGESISSNLTLQNGGCIILGEDYYTTHLFYSVGSETILYTTTSNDYSQTDIEVTESFHLGLKIIKRGKERLGWVKLSVHGISCEAFEFTIQK
jgi:hypothetical protein